jgi:hypothetical protein
MLVNFIFAANRKKTEGQRKRIGTKVKGQR